MTLKLLKSVWTNENSKTTGIIFTDVIYKCVNYDITQKPVSVHYPLTRFFAGLLAQCGRLNIPLTSLPISSQILDASERSFRSLALCAQVNAGAWRRNGLGLAKQVYYTRHHQCRSESFDRDLQMLQACAALVDPNQFCLILRQKFNLVNTPGFEEVRKMFSLVVFQFCVSACNEYFDVFFPTTYCNVLVKFVFVSTHSFFF